MGWKTRGRGCSTPAAPGGFTPGAGGLSKGQFWLVMETETTRMGPSSRSSHANKEIETDSHPQERPALGEGGLSQDCSLNPSVMPSLGMKDI